jgi:hypothetical protein
MSVEEHNSRLQNAMESHVTKVPVIVLQRVEERFPAVREGVVSAVCTGESFIILFLGSIWPKEQNVL